MPSPLGLLGRARSLFLALAAGVVTLGAAASLHDEDSDAQLYTVVARNIARSGDWFDLRYAGNVHPHFREHLPFGLWPTALAIRLFGVAAADALAVLGSLATLGVLGFWVRRLTGEVSTAALAVVVLATTEQFVRVGAVFRLDGPLLLCALLSLVPVTSDERPTVKGWLVTAVAVLGATLVKGPFGLVLIAAAGLARAVDERSWRWLVWAASAAVVGALGVTAFLLHARATGSDWWTGYVEQQLLASASGGRTDGNLQWWFPLASLGSRYWPWLPLVLVGAWRAVAQPKGAARVLGLTLLFALVALMLPARKLWHHTLLLFPLASALVALGVQPWVAGWRPRWQALALGGAVLGCAAFVLATPGSRAATCTAFAPALAGQSGRVLVTRTPSGRMWREISTLALETPLEPWLVTTLDEAPADWAMVATDVEVDPTGWKEQAATPRWRLLRKE